LQQNLLYYTKKEKNEKNRRKIDATASSIDRVSALIERMASLMSEVDRLPPPQFRSPRIGQYILGLSKDAISQLDDYWSYVRRCPGRWEKKSEGKSERKAG